MLGHAPGEPERAHLSLRRRASADDLQRGGIEIGLVHVLREDAAEHAAVVRQPLGQRVPVARDLEHPALLLRAREFVERIGGVGRSKQDLDEDPRERLHHGAVERAVHPDDATVDRHGVRGLGALHGRPDARRHRRAARVRVLDHDRGRLVELEQQRERGREVEQVVVAELRAMQLFHRGQPDRRCARDLVKRRGLMRIFAVFQTESPFGA